MRKTFKKEERLCNKSLLSKLFHSGSSFVVYPYRVVYMDIPRERIAAPVNVVISVSKRRFKAAHDRNRIKRLMREVYRLQKDALLYPVVEKRLPGLLLAVQFVGKEEIPFTTFYAKMEKALIQLSNDISQ